MLNKLKLIETYFPKSVLSSQIISDEFHKWNLKLELEKDILEIKIKIVIICILKLI